jgi:hypothetical protein
MQSLSPRSCARRDPRQGGSVGVVAVKHSARAPRETRRQRMSQQTCVRSLLNAPTCSLRSDLVSAMPLAQEISATRGYLGPEGVRVGPTRQPFPLLQRCAERQRDDYAQKRSSLLLCRGQGAHMRCSPRKSPNPRQPDRNRGVPDAANTRA